MKKGALHFLTRKNNSLFDTNIKVQELDPVEFTLDSSAIPESGTAKVRSRPTVKHFTSSSDVAQGFAVPTPKVPLLPPSNGLTTNGLVSADRLSNGSVISVSDLIEGEILVPPHPSVAPPPPPVKVISPPSEFMGYSDSVNPSALLPPSMIPPNPPAMMEQEEDFTFLKPPPMAPPKPPSTSSAGSASSLHQSTLGTTATVPDFSDCPKFIPPQPPAHLKSQKTPPPKPMRFSSIPSIDGPPPGPAPAPPVQNPRPSSFNPQNTAKLYSVPKTSILGGHVDHEKRPKQILLLEDTGSGQSVKVPVQIDGKAPSMAPPSKPVRKNSGGTQLEKDLKEFKENLQANPPSQTPKSHPKKEGKVEAVSTQQKVITPATSSNNSPKLKKIPIASLSPETSQVKLEGSPRQIHKFSPLIDRKLRNLKNNEPSGRREGPAASPMALLMAAKEREKHRPSLSRENSTKSEKSSATIHPSDSSPNSFIVTPRSTSPSSLNSLGIAQENAKAIPVVPKVTKGLPEKLNSPAPVRAELPVTNPSHRVPFTATPTPASTPAERPSPSPPSSRNNDEDEENIGMPLLPPPPEFANFDISDEVIDAPPSFPPPDPPVKKVTPPPPTSSVLSDPPAPVPAPPPKPKPPPPPSLPPPNTDIKPKVPPQTKPKVPAPTQAPTPLTPSQATLLSILQKKMLEMDHKIAPPKESEQSSDDWGSPLSDEENKFPVVSKAPPKSKATTLPVKTVKTVGLDMRELENKVAQKSQDVTSNGPQSKHRYGMTFTVRPGTKQPITLVSKGEES